MAAGAGSGPWVQPVDNSNLPWQRPVLLPWRNPLRTKPSRGPGAGPLGVVGAPALVAGLALTPPAVLSSTPPASVRTNTALKPLRPSPPRGFDLPAVAAT